jgi:hypothetical protein
MKMKSPKNDRRKKLDRAIRACGYRLKRGASRYKNVVLKGCSDCGAWTGGAKRRAKDSVKLANRPLRN